MTRHHPVLDRINIDAPSFRRCLTHEAGGGTHDCELQLWLPVQLDNGGWVSAVRIEGIDMPLIAAMPGDDPLAALIGALAFARDVVNRQPGRVLFGDRGGRRPARVSRSWLSAVRSGEGGSAGLVLGG